MSFHFRVIAATILMTSLPVVPADVAAQSAYCGTATVGTCAGGATVAGSVWSRGDGFTCLWECEAPDSTLHRCSFGDAGTQCPLLSGTTAPALEDKAVRTSPFARDGVPVVSRYREHNPFIAQTVEGEVWRICDHRVDTAADLDVLGDIGLAFGWWTSAPVATDWAATWQPLIEGACYQVVAGYSARPIFFRTERELHSYLRSTQPPDTTPPEMAGACLFLFESDTTQRARYAAAAPPPGERTNFLGDLWIDEAPGGGCPCATEVWECGDDMCPPLAAGDVIDGVSCGQPACFAALATHWGPDPSTICDGTSYTQTNACDSSFQTSVGTDPTPTCVTTPPTTCVGGVWTPDVSTVCSGTTFTQSCVATPSLTQTTTGTDTTSTACTCTGGWDPAPATVCDGTSFTQTCLSNSALTQPATGTDTTSSACTCPGGWTPDPSTACASSGTFTQTCLSNPSLTQQETGTKTIGCPVECCPATQGTCLQGGSVLTTTTTPLTGRGGIYHYTLCQFSEPPLPMCSGGGIYAGQFFDCYYQCDQTSRTWENDLPPAQVCDSAVATRITTYDCGGTPETREEEVPGRMTCGPTCAGGTWGPHPSTECLGSTFTQTCSYDSGITQSSVGTSTGACPPPLTRCTDRSISGWGSWSPSGFSVCQGSSFTQTRTRTCAPGTPGAGTCTTSCSGVTRTDTQSAIGTNLGVCGTSCTDRVIAWWGGWAPPSSTVCQGASFTQTRTRACTPGTSGTGTCVTSCSGVTTHGTQTATGTDSSCVCSYPTACGTFPSCYACSCAPDCGTYPSCHSCGGCGGGQVDLGCGCGNAAPGACGCGSQVDQGCGCGAGLPGPCGCGSQVDQGCGCGAGLPGPCGCGSQVDQGCGCGAGLPGPCGCGSQVDLGCGCGNAAPGACGCGNQVDLGCGCGNPAASCWDGGCPPCRPQPVCPAGTTGTPPNCERIVTVCTSPTPCGSPGNCYAACWNGSCSNPCPCPTGQLGTPPNCYTPPCPAATPCGTPPYGCYAECWDGTCSTSCPPRVCEPPNQCGTHPACRPCCTATPYISSSTRTTSSPTCTSTGTTVTTTTCIGGCPGDCTGYPQSSTGSLPRLNCPPRPPVSCCAPTTTCVAGCVVIATVCTDYPAGSTCPPISPITTGPYPTPSCPMGAC